MNSDSNIRTHSISIFNNFYQSLKEDDFLWFIFHYLADPVDTVINTYIKN